jgi:hypothetical protein
MKTLIENSIKGQGLGYSNPKTIFDEESNRKTNHYLDLSKFKGRTIFFKYKYSEDSKEFDSAIKIVVPNLDDQGIKDFIIAEINKVINP